MADGQAALGWDTLLRCAPGNFSGFMQKSDIEACVFITKIPRSKSILAKAHPKQKLKRKKDAFVSTPPFVH